jgi:hypothetical protein
LQVSSCSEAPNDRPAKIQSATELIGTWRLISWQTRRSDGTVRQPFGTEPFGVLTYDASGRMAGQMMRSDRPRFLSTDWAGGTPEEIKQAFAGYVAYSGTYLIDEQRRTVTHHVDASLFPNWVGEAQVRHFAFDGTRLVLRTPPVLVAGQEQVGELVWERTA